MTVKAPAGQEACDATSGSVHASHALPPASEKKILLITLLAFVAALFVGAAIMVVVEANDLRNKQKAAGDLAYHVAKNIYNNLTRNLSATYALAAIIRQNQGNIKDFEQLANEMLQLYGGIDSLQLAPGGVISLVVPLEGNQKAIGHDLLQDTKRNREALLALSTRKLTLAGPFELVQGGKGVVGRLPVFVPSKSGEDRFWGFTAVLIRIPHLATVSDLKKIVEAGYNYEISRIHPDTGKREIFIRSSTRQLESPVQHSVEVPNATWMLSLEPIKGWGSPGARGLGSAVVLLFSVLVAAMVRTLFRQPVLLQRMVDERTRQLFEANQQLTHEISDRVKAEEARRYNESRLRESQGVAHIGHYEFNIVSGTWTGSEELDAIFGIDSVYPRTLQGWLGVVHPEQQEEIASHLQQDVLEQRQAFNREYRILRISDHALRWVHGLGRLEMDADGRPVSMFGTVQDITERKLIEEDRRLLETQMQHAQKLESLGVLAGGIAHDFNNILLAIMGNNELAMMRLDPDSPARDNLAKVHQAAQRAAELARQMLAYSGKGRFQIEMVDLGEMVNELAHMLEVSVSKKAALRFRLAENLPPVEVDATQLRQVLMNLVINASEAIGENSGVITISTGALHCDRKYLAGMWMDEQLAEGLYVYVEVTDNGCGMNRETLAKIFDPFFSTKFTGRGLGMAAVLGIVRGHRGVIKVYSEPGRGSVFKVLLPAAQGQGQVGTRLNGETELHWKGSGTILLVDDEETVRTLGKEMLEMLGFNVITACDGREGLEIFTTCIDPITAVILDLTMPDMDGKETFRELRRIKPEVCVIMSSGYSEQEVSQLSISNELCGFIQKPYRLVDLVDVLRLALEQRAL